MLRWKENEGKEGGLWLLRIRELLFTLFKIKHFSLFAQKSVRKSELACKIRIWRAEK